MKSTILSLAAIALVAGSCHNNQPVANTSIGQDTIPVKVMQLEKADSRQQVFATGQFTTDDETSLSFKNGGIIDRIYVKEGDAVNKGQLLATLHLAEINAQAEQATLSVQKAERDYNRASALYKDSVATLEQMQNAKTALDVARQQLTAIRFNQSYSEIKAPSSGFVLRKFVNEGQVTGPGTPVLMVNGAGKGSWLLKVGVSDRQWAAIQAGDKATIETDALPGQTIAAVVSKKPEGVDPASGTFIIQLQLQQKPTAIASGLFGKATITPSHAVNGWTIPYDALLDGDQNQGYVFITNDNKTATKVKVTLGGIDNNKVLVTGGLDSVKAIIISGNAYLNDHSPILIQNTTHP
ncbi:RND family efflux transporter, MFP subunit [Filimonas lacunae]|uniref:RND family efflux transporter, MFP subunit n=1 Tax=Filimonas lacunae TaxID=477680 RepID=A0A173MJ53_9BACT|nr:efflux RND transporter periplasmic adaptor subunit [Filimonas lacunae]BAV07509.1 membrane-fusion protein [Filimonas lacunae]SIT30140.1 RND family efflux transporter, MFP subunit [Filimonas lacunae]